MSGILLDSHVVIWWFEKPRSISPAAREVILAEGARVVVSAATVWEIAIKKAAGRLRTPDNLLEVLEIERFEVLPVSGEHAIAAARLPRKHKDPFDRMLVAQAMAEHLVLVTRDPESASYGVPCILA